MTTQSISIVEFKGFDRKVPPARLSPGVFYDATNVINHKTNIEKLFGIAKWGGVLNASGSPEAVQLIDEFYMKSDITYLIAITVGGLYLWDSNTSTWVNKALFSGSLDHPVTGDIWAADDWYVFTSSSYYPKYFDGSTVTNLTTYINAAQAIAVWDNRVWLGNITDSTGTAQPQRLMWSSAGDATEFDPNATDSDAGDLYLLDTAGWIQAIVPIGQYLFIYKDRSVTLIKPADVGYEAYTLVKDIGVLSPGGIINMGTSHIYMGSDDVYSIDMGGNVTSLAESVKLWLLGPAGVVNRNYALRSFAFYVEELEECWFFVPVGDSQNPNAVVRYNPFEDTWTYREFGQTFTNYGFTSSTTSLTWSSASGTWSDYQRPWLQQKAQSILSTLLGGSDGQCYEMSADYMDDDGTALTGTLTTGDFYSADKGVRLKTLDVVYSGGPIAVEYSTDGGSSWNSLVTLSAVSGEVEYRYKCNKWAKKFRFKFSSDHYFKINLIKIDLLPEGWQRVN